MVIINELKGYVISENTDNSLVTLHQDFSLVKDCGVETRGGGGYCNAVSS